MPEEDATTMPEIQKKPKELVRALAKAQAEFEVVATNKETEYRSKNGGTISFKWATLGQLRQAVNPILGKHGLAVMQDGI